MDDNELQAIRAARLQEMQQRSQNSGTGNGGNSRLLSVLAPAARERLERVRMVKPERAALIESQIAQVYRGGVISEEDIISLLRQIDSNVQRGVKIEFLRKQEPELEESTNSDSDDFFD